MTANGRIQDFDYEPGGCGTQALVYGIIIAIIWLFSSCKSVQYVPVIENHTDTVLITKHQRDSVWLHDSTHVKEYIKGDTQYVELTRWHIKYVEKQVHDTTYVAKRDTVPMPYEVIKEVPAKLSKTQKGLMSIGIFTLMAAIIFIGFKIRKFLP